MHDFKIFIGMIKILLQNESSWERKYLFFLWLILNRMQVDFDECKYWFCYCIIIIATWHAHMRYNHIVEWLEIRRQKRQIRNGCRSSKHENRANKKIIS